MRKKLLTKRTIQKASRVLFTTKKKRKAPKSSSALASVRSKQQFVDYPIVHIGSGSKVIFSPEGTEYSQDKLKKIYDKSEKSQWFSITPVCQYQIDAGWPDVEEFVNVNLLGSIETEKDNWLGYIGAWHDDEKQTYVVENLIKLLATKRPLLQGKLVKESDGEYRIIFFVSRTALEEAVKQI